MRKWEGFAVLFVFWSLLNSGSINSLTPDSEKESEEGYYLLLHDRFEKDGWEVELLDTARDADYLSPVEKDVILSLNAVRTNPKKFAELYVRPVSKKFKGKIMVESGGRNIQTREGVKAVHLLYRKLRNTKKLPIQQPSRGLSRAAEDHALDQAKTGRVGHAGSDGSAPFERMNRYGKWQRSAGENISYGSSDGLAIVLQLLIDDGVPSRGHRKNILSPAFKKVGVGLERHSRYGMTCVMDYAGDYTEGESKGE